MGFADLWKQAAEDDWEPPAGTYKTRVVDASAFTSRDGREFCKVRLEVTEGHGAGRAWDHIMGFSSAIAARISRGSLVMYGLDAEAITDFDELDVAMARLIGTKCEVAVKHKDGYINTDVLRSFTGESDVPAEPERFQHTPAGGDDDDPLPY